MPRVRIQCHGHQKFQISVLKKFHWSVGHFAAHAWVTFFFLLYIKELLHTEYFVKQDGKVLIKMHSKISIPLDMSYQEFIFTPALKEWL